MPNILVVEDSPTMRQLISFAMKRIPKAKVIEAPPVRTAGVAVEP